ncbi:hypothetical protein BWI17_18260 [Betaproteobacteria bacterium GR16-43]|nr:hypothetical protein BWI17_18260 [Betaproteobacteria bacterium GR16-43]
MKALAAIALLALAVPAHADKATLPIRVVSKSGTDTRAFQGVGPFEIKRNSAKFADATCPDESDSDGKLVCVVTCSKTDDGAKTLMLVPPSKGGRTKGYVAPTAQELKLTKCTLSPATERTFEYLDAGSAVRLIVVKYPDLGAAVKPGPGDWQAFTIATDPKSIEAYERVGSTPEGRADLFRLQAANIAAFEKRSGSLASEANVEGFSNVVGSIYLKELAKSQVGDSVAASVKVSKDKDAYFKNLSQIERALDSKVGRSTRQNILLNDVQSWKSLPPSKASEATLKSMDLFESGGKRQ